MTDEPEDTIEETAEELAFYEGGIELASSGYGGRYSTSHQDTQNYLALKNDIEDKLAKGEPVYVQIMDDRRKGSVGRIKTITFEFVPAGQRRSYYGSSYNDYLGIRDIEVVWDGRKNSCKPLASEVEYLPNWHGGTQWQWTKGVPKEKEPVVQAYDHLGQEIVAGQFVCFVHRRYGTISMKFGTVTRITPKGGVFVKTLKLRDGDRAGEELRALDMDDICIVNDKLMGRLMMARLSAD
jgi:hypothetical protein